MRTDNIQASKGQRSTIIGIVISSILALAKAVGGIVGHSHALIADAIESTTDIFTSAILLAGLKWSVRPADHDHPYGHGKGEALISLGIALALCGAAVLIAVASIRNLQTPHQNPEPYTLVILAIVIVIKEVLYRYVLKAGKEVGSGAVLADAFHHRADAITSAAAFIGISVALLGGDGYEVADEYAALLASAVIMVNAYHIARPAAGELLDEDLDPALTLNIKNLAIRVERVIHVEQCKVRKMGIFKIADMHIWVNKNLTVEEGHDIAHHVKEVIQKEYPFFADVMIHIEPAR